MKDQTPGCQSVARSDYRSEEPIIQCDLKRHLDIEMHKHWFDDGMKERWETGGVAG